MNTKRGRQCGEPKGLFETQLYPVPAHHYNPNDRSVNPIPSPRGRLVNRTAATNRVSS